MKRLFFSLFFFLFLLLPFSVYAEEGWIIDEFISDIYIQKNGAVKIIEIIDVNFYNLSKHGIFRDIPYAYEASNDKTYSEIDIKSIRQNSQKAQFSTSKENGYLRLKIGDPEKTISGKNKYEIEYEVKGILRGFPEYDEFYWNVTGNNWPIEIRKVYASVTMPDNGILINRCFEGYAGSTAECMILDESPTSVRFASNSSLSEAQGLTVVVGYRKNLIPLLIVEKPKTFWEKFIEWPSITTLALIIFSGIGFVVYTWHKSGRDYWFGQNIFGKKDDTGHVKPIGAHEATVVEFTPPDNLRPAEVGVLMDEKADTLDVVATIIDLATRGHLMITEVPKKWLFGKTDYKLKKLPKANESELLGYEKMLLDELFKGTDIVNVSNLKQSFYDELKKIKDELYKEIVSKKLFPTDPEKVRSKYITTAFIMIFVGLFFIGYTVSLDAVFLADICIGILTVGFLLLLSSRHMPRRTAYGRELYRRIKGYRLFIDKAEKHRQKFFERKNLFNEALPFAIVFGLTGKFATAMKEIGVTTAQTGWYSGTHHFNSHNFSSSMNDFSQSLSSAMASTPSSSGGFSGGSSGGGFGGGGGGSW